MEPSRKSGGSTYWTLSCTLERRLFFQFVLGTLICLCNGAVFCFGIFSPFLKKGAFKYNQSQLNWVSTIGFIMCYFSLPAGFLFDYKGPMLTILTGTLMSAVGWFGMFLMFLNEENPVLGTSMFTLCFFYGLSQLTNGFFETGSILTNLETFSCYKGRVILIQKTFIGLGSSVIVQLYIAFFETRFDGIAPYFLFLFGLIVFSGCLGTIFIRLPTDKTRCVGLNVMDEDMIKNGRGESTLFRVPFNIGTAVLFTSLVFYSAATLLENYFTLNDSARIVVGLCSIFLFACFGLMILFTPNYSLLSDNDNNVCGEAEDEESAKKRSQPDATERAEANGDADAAARDPPRGARGVKSYPVDEDPVRLSTTSGREAPGENGDISSDVEHSSEQERSLQNSVFNADSTISRMDFKLNTDTLWSNLRRRELWLMWIVCFASWSSATLVSTNSAQIYQSLDIEGFSSTVNVVFVSIYGIANAVGRVFVGAVHPFLMARKISVTVLLTFGPILNVCGLLLFLIVPVKVLVLPYFLVGFGTGVSWACTLLTVKELFSPDNCGKHYAALYTAGIVSPLIFNVALFGPIYDYYSKKQGLWEERLCEGLPCIVVPLAVCAAVNFISFPLSIYFVMRVKKRRGIV